MSRLQEGFQAIACLTSAWGPPLLRSSLPGTKRKKENNQDINHFSSKPIPFQSCRLTQFGSSSASRFACSPFPRESGILYLLFFQNQMSRFQESFQVIACLMSSWGPPLLWSSLPGTKRKIETNQDLNIYFFLCQFTFISALQFGINSPCRLPCSPFPR